MEPIGYRIIWLFTDCKQKMEPVNLNSKVSLIDFQIGEKTFYLYKFEFQFKDNIFDFEIQTEKEIIREHSRLHSIPIFFSPNSIKEQILGNPTIPWLSVQSCAKSLQLALDFCYTPFKINNFSNTFQNFLLSQEQDIPKIENFHSPLKGEYKFFMFNTLKRIMLNLRPFGLPLSNDELIDLCYDTISWFREYVISNDFLDENDPNKFKNFKDYEKFFSYLLHDLEDAQLFGFYSVIFMYYFVYCNNKTPLELLPIDFPMTEEGSYDKRNFEVIERCSLDFGKNILLASYNIHFHQEFLLMKPSFFIKQESSSNTGWEINLLSDQYNQVEFNKSLLEKVTKRKTIKINPKEIQRNLNEFEIFQSNLGTQNSSKKMCSDSSSTQIPKIETLIGTKIQCDFSQFDLPE